MRNDTPSTAIACMTDESSTPSSPICGEKTLLQLTNLVEGKASWGESQKDLLVRATGRFYTHPLIGRHLAEAMARLGGALDELSPSVIDPFCGDGRLVCWLMEAVTAIRGKRLRKWRVTLWDCDGPAVEMARENVLATAARLGEPVEVFTRVGNSFEIAREHFGQFSACVTNPPWEVLKPDRREMDGLSKSEAAEYTQLLRQQDKFLAATYPRSAPLRKFSGWGTNLARCGTEVALRLVVPGGSSGIVSPASLLADQMSEKLRRWVFDENDVQDLAYYAAEAKLFEGVDQPSITLVASPGRKTASPPSLTIFDRAHERSVFPMGTREWEGLEATGYVFPMQFGLGLLRLGAVWGKFPKFAEMEGAGPTELWAGRELDETGYEGYLADVGEYLFVKGRTIKRFGMAEAPARYVKADGPRIPKTADFHRLVWRDVARQNQKRRVHATILPPGQVTGNSLNVAYYRDGNLPRLKALLGVMNSLVFEAQARMYLATAHVSLGAIRQVRVPHMTDPEVIDAIARLVERCENEDEAALAALEVYVARLYGLTREEFALVLSSFEKLEDAEKAVLLSEELWGTPPEPKPRRRGKPAPLPSGKIPNHESAKMSELDMAIARSVPPGGNWKDIPASVPSGRVQQIRASFERGEGSRSTYYGRLRGDAPAYTINTYFTRPGNGCHLHYDSAQDRTLSHREAARLQSFPDSFAFHGVKGSVCNQIGNAVPPLLAYQIARALPFRGQYVDLFSGAGGLALGFKWAGWEPLVGNDIDASFLDTYRANIHDNAVCGDIRDQAVFDALVEQVQSLRSRDGVTPLFVLGGPPCQGFSTAGNRRSMDDDRNWLFKQYKAFLEVIKPDGFVFENVTGLLSMEGGKVFEMIQHELRETTPNLGSWKLKAEEYGVPQRRTRVVLLGDNTGKALLTPPPPVTQFAEKTGLFATLPQVIGVADALSDLPPLKAGEDGSAQDYLSEPTNAYQALMRGQATAEEYLSTLKKG